MGSGQLSALHLLLRPRWHNVKLDTNTNADAKIDVYAMIEPMVLVNLTHVAQCENVWL